MTEQRVVRTGKIVTGAGVSAGIDMALTLVGLMDGTDLAEAIQLGIEYDPQPPYDAGAPSKARPEIKDLVEAGGRPGRSCDLNDRRHRPNPRIGSFGASDVVVVVEDEVPAVHAVLAAVDDDVAGLPGRPRGVGEQVGAAAAVDAVDHRRTARAGRSPVAGLAALGLVAAEAGHAVGEAGGEDRLAARAGPRWSSASSSSSPRPS